MYIIILLENNYPSNITTLRTNCDEIKVTKTYDANASFFNVHIYYVQPMDLNARIGP